MLFDANTVWGCAVAVDRVQGGYFKDDVYEYQVDEDGEEVPVHVKHPNKIIMRRMLAGTVKSIVVTDNDIAEGLRLRHYFNGYLMKELAGTINDFERTVLKIAQMETFTNRDMLQFAIISCLPNSYRRELKNKEYKQEVMESTPIDALVGDVIQGDLIIVKCYYNQNYNKFRVTGRFGEAFVDFWYKDNLEVDQTYKIKGKVKQLRPDNTTQLHYVKKLSE